MGIGARPQSLGNIENCTIIGDQQQIDIAIAEIGDRAGNPALRAGRAQFGARRMARFVAHPRQERDRGTLRGRDLMEANVGVEPVCTLELGVEHLERRDGGAETFDVCCVLGDERRSGIEAFAAIILLDEAHDLRSPLRLPCADILLAFQGGGVYDATISNQDEGCPARRISPLGIGAIV